MNAAKPLLYGLHGTEEGCQQLMGEYCGGLRRSAGDVNILKCLSEFTYLNTTLFGKTLPQGWIQTSFSTKPEKKNRKTKKKWNKKITDGQKREKMTIYDLCPVGVTSLDIYTCMEPLTLIKKRRFSLEVSPAGTCTSIDLNHGHATGSKPQTRIIMQIWSLQYISKLNKMGFNPLNSIGSPWHNNIIFLEKLVLFMFWHFWS
ncbi:hypothetical protein ACJX0J_031541 [Zea mays]